MFEKISWLFKNNKEFRPGIFLVVYKTDKTKKPEYLVLKRKLHWKGWEFTKGGKEKNESDLEAVKRELKEESGLKMISIQSYKKKGRYIYDKKTRNGRGKVGQTFKLYSVRVKPGKVKISKLEHSGYKWADFKTAMKMLTWKNQKECLGIVNKKIGK